MTFDDFGCFAEYFDQRIFAAGCIQYQHIVFGTEYLLQLFDVGNIIDDRVLWIFLSKRLTIQQLQVGEESKGNFGLRRREKAFDFTNLWLTHNKKVSNFIMGEINYLCVKHKFTKILIKESPVITGFYVFRMNRDATDLTDVAFRKLNERGFV